MPLSLSLPVLSSHGLWEKRQGLSLHCLRCQCPLNSSNESSISVPPTLLTSSPTALAQSSARHARFQSNAFQVGDYSAGDTHNVSRCSTKVVIPRSRCSPHLVVLQQVRVYEHTKLSAVTKGRHAVVDFGNLMAMGVGHWRNPVIYETRDMCAVERPRDDCAWSSSTEDGN